MGDYNRPVMVKTKGQTRCARFKTWSVSNTFGFEAIPRTQPVAVVEYGDGTVEYVPVDVLKFTDSNDSEGSAANG
jgi:hypothetical protein